MAQKSPKHEMALRIWIGIVAFMALGNTFACFFGSPSFLQTKLYNSKPEQSKFIVYGIDIHVHLHI